MNAHPKISIQTPPQKRKQKQQTPFLNGIIYRSHVLPGVRPRVHASWSGNMPPPGGHCRRLSSGREDTPLGKTSTTSKLIPDYFLFNCSMLGIHDVGGFWNNQGFADVVFWDECHHGPCLWPATLPNHGDLGKFDWLPYVVPIQKDSYLTKNYSVKKTGKNNRKQMRGATVRIKQRDQIQIISKLIFQFVLC